MATIEKVKAQIQSLIDASNEKTGQASADLTSAVNVLIEGYGTGSGESSELVKYVTFMSEDGTTELYKMPVLNGDTCKNPITTGDIETPTKESTAQYTFTYSGWALEQGGESSSYALVSVTEDRTVYASFTSAVRYYTVTFYDGETLLETKSLAYGTMPTPDEPMKENYDFTGWNPELSAVTGDATYTAVFEYNDGYIKDTWAEINENITNGTYKTKYAIGDKKQIQLESMYGDTATTYTMDVEIVAFDHDINSDGKTTGITFMTSNLISLEGRIYNSTSSSNSWEKSTVRTYLSQQVSKLDSELTAIIQSVQKSNNNAKDSTAFTAVYDKLWIVSSEELGFTDYTNSYDKPYSDYFVDDASRIKTPIEGYTLYDNWGTRTVVGTGYVHGVNYSSGKQSGSVGWSSSYENKRASLVGFAVGVKPE